tara:strand:+ start:86 stop:454 length:369 start_codon:yes stop_codon:yes gene_type:complete
MKVRLIIKEQMATNVTELQAQLDSAIENALSQLDTANDPVVVITTINKAIELLNNAGSPLQEKKKKMTKSDVKKREKIVKGMKGSKKDFEKRYGEDAEDVMYATATKMAMNATKMAMKKKKK